MQVKGAEQLKPWEEIKPESFLAGGEWSKVTLGTVNKEMFCLLCVGTKLLVLQMCPPTVVLVLEEAAHGGEQTLQPLPLLLLGLQDGAPIRAAWSASALSTILGSVFRAASCWGAGKHPEQEGEQKGDEGALHGRGCPELCVLECSRAAGSR